MMKGAGKIGENHYLVVNPHNGEKGLVLVEGEGRKAKENL